jgi:hypothetical protein
VTPSTTEKTYHTRNSEKCYRFKPDAFCSHAPTNRGIYELVTFDVDQKAVILYVGAAFEKGIRECLEAHAEGSLKPTAEELFAKHPNLYFDYLIEMDAKTKEDAQDIYWWLVQKHKPPYNDIPSIHPSGRTASVNVVEFE